MDLQKRLWNGRPRYRVGAASPAVSWADVVRWAGRSYLGTGATVPTERRGRLLGTVLCDISMAPVPLLRAQRDGDATFAAGRKLYAVRDLPPARALLVELRGEYWRFDLLEGPEQPSSPSNSPAADRRSRR